MKHYFHFLFACALLLGSLIVFNVQKPECVTLVSENPDIEHVALQAEISSNQTAASSVPSSRPTPEVAYKSVSGKLNHPDYLNSSDHQAQIKMQMLIHLELLPVLGIQSGQDLHHRSSYDDPPFLS